MKRKGEGDAAAITVIGVIAVLLLGGIVVGAMWGCPKYNVWEKGMLGESELRRAEWNRQVAIKEAEAKRESAKALAEAEVERAKGVAEANRIIGQSLHDNEAYLRYLWIHSLGEGKNEVIYVPTEANLPILEAARLKK